MSQGPVELVYTFGNHQHWVDFHWLWGYDVLPSALTDMLAFCDATGARGCVNFDGVGYEKLASETPEALALLRELVQGGRFEIVGGSYGQPYGLFHGGEANIRQRVYGVRAVKRLLGVDVETFWEEEFDFFPQLPQILAGVGIRGASLYFQWTWHTPEVPREPHPVVWWQGPDGSRLLCATRNRLNLHQWPEDFQILLDELAAKGADEVLRQGFEPADLEQAPHVPPQVLQWLELMPSQDWMCRSELMIPKMKALQSDSRFQITNITLGQYLERVRREVDAERLPVRQYAMDEVWHGMSLGKNGDRMRRASRQVEHELLAMESLMSVLGLFGRPYAQWDVYPTWEIEEGWRQLLVGQHHDNDECEGLCGYVGAVAYETALGHAANVKERAMDLLAKRIEAPEGSVLAINPLGWPRRVVDELEGERLEAVVPAFGFALMTSAAGDPCRWKLEDGVATGERGDVRVRIDARTGGILELTNSACPAGPFVAAHPAMRMGFMRDKQRVDMAEWCRRVRRETVVDGGRLLLMFSDESTDLRIEVGIDAVSGALVYELDVFGLPLPDGGLASGLQAEVPIQWGRTGIVADQPLSVLPVEPTAKGLKKYPTGDWMTSPQWFEEVHDALTSYSLIEWQADHASCLVLHDGSQQWFAEDGRLRCVLTMNDPWDEDRVSTDVAVRFAFVLHGGELTPSDKWRLAQEFQRVPLLTMVGGGSGVPASFAGVGIEGPAVATAFYRETEHDGRRYADYAGLGMGHPYVLRLAEFDGVGGEVRVRVPGTPARAYQTDLLGRIRAELAVDEGNLLRVVLKPFEIATLYMDLVEGRKVFRDLDAHREVWATVHRVEE